MNLPSIPGRIAGKIRRSALKIRDQARLLLKATSTLLVRTNVRRWRKVAMEPTPPWDERNHFIAGLIPAGSSVLDIGSGGQSLRRHLKSGCKYQPCDLVKSSPDVILCDFNAAIFPDILEQYDYVVCSGILEYIRDPVRFLDAVASYGNVVILSYHPFTQGSSKLPRLAHDWINHMTSEELNGIFDQVVVKWEVLRSGNGECIYSLKSPSACSESCSKV